jgi:hypothetical protein
LWFLFLVKSFLPFISSENENPLAIIPRQDLEKRIYIQVPLNGKEEILHPLHTIFGEEKETNMQTNTAEIFLRDQFRLKETKISLLSAFSQ